VPEYEREHVEGDESGEEEGFATGQAAEDEREVRERQYDGSPKARRRRAAEANAGDCTDDTETATEGVARESRFERVGDTGHLCFLTSS